MKRVICGMAIMFGMGILTASADDAAQVTFSRDVAPIFFQACVSCHRPGEIAPMSLMDYESARPYAKSIKKAVVEKTMPPWHADSSLKKYKNDMSLSPAQIDTIANWVNQGAGEGNKADLPKAPEFVDGWAMGTPDLIFHATRDFHIPAKANEIEYQAISFDTSKLTEDLYISSWEIRPTVGQTVHHANLALSPKSFEGVPSGSIISHAAMTRGDYIGSYLPGARPTTYPEGYAYKLPANSFFAIQVHYVGLENKDVTDHLMFGVKLAQGRVDKRVRVVGTDDRAIFIPPGDPNWELVGKVGFLYDTLVMSSGIHMHLRGKDYTMEIVKADGTAELVTKVPKYDFNWQASYWLAEPMLAPKGSTLRTTAHWDNSANNPHNPDPTVEVKNGPWTYDEMLNSWTHCVLAEEKLGLKVADGKVIGKFEDAQAKDHPLLIQTLPGAIRPGEGDAKFFPKKPGTAGQ